MEARTALVVALLLSFSILAIELAGGVLFQSSALIADALHVVTDILAVAFSLAALSISARPPTDSLTYGYHRYEVIASLVNGLSLLAIAGVIVYQAYLRFLSPQPVGVVGTVAFASVALGLNLLASRVLQGAQAGLHGEQDLNVSSATVHMLGDGLASLAVIVGAVAIWFTGLYYLDPLVAVFIGLIVIRSAVSITRQGGAIILERSPFEDMWDLQEGLGTVAGIKDVHDLHVWRICSHITVASMHACLDEAGKRDPAGVRGRLEGELGRLGMQHVTIQLEEVHCAPQHSH